GVDGTARMSGTSSMSRANGMSGPGARSRSDHLLDRLVRPEIAIFGQMRSSFQVCGFTGLALGALCGLGLVLRLGLSPWVLGGLVLAAVTAFLLVAVASKLLLGAPRLVFYHHAIALVAAAAGFLWLAGEPVLPYLDVAVL